MDLASLALTASGAKSADSRESRMLGGGDDLEIPLSLLLFELWQIDDRLAKSEQRNWRMGVRLSPNADVTSLLACVVPD